MKSTEKSIRMWLECFDIIERENKRKEPQKTDTTKQRKKESLDHRLRLETYNLCDNYDGDIV